MNPAFVHAISVLCPPESIRPFYISAVFDKLHLVANFFEKDLP
jgi:hypothetical protein